MKSFSYNGRWLWSVCLLLVSGHAGLCVNPPSGVTADEIMRKAVQRAQAASGDARRADYAYTKRVLVQDFDTQGRLTETKEKLFRFRSGLGSLEQVKINGTIDGARLKKEEDHFARESAQLMDAKSCKRDDRWEKYLTPDLAAKYRFTLRDHQVLNGRPAFVIAFQPRSGELPVNQMADRLLNHLAGTVWIDELEFEIVRADLTAQSKVTLGGIMELLGSLSRFNFVLERVRLDDGTWFNRRASGDFEGRKLLDNTHVKTRSETSGFHKTGAEP